MFSIYGLWWNHLGSKELRDPHAAPIASLFELALPKPLTFISRYSMILVSFMSSAQIQLRFNLHSFISWSLRASVQGLGP